MPHDDSPKFTNEMAARARPAVEVLPPEVIGAFKKGRGPQKAPTKTPVSIRLDPDVLEHFRATGTGWQSRINETLRAAIKAPS